MVKPDKGCKCNQQIKYGQKINNISLYTEKLSQTKNC